MADETQSESGDGRDILLELNFVPTWARRPPGINPYVETEREGRKRERAAPAGRRVRRTERRPARGPRRERPEQPSAARLPFGIEVAFIPEKNRLGNVVRQLHSGRRAYPLMDLAALFMARPENYLVKITVQSGRDEDVLLQCAKCRALFADRAAFQAHAIAEHMQEHFEVEEHEGEEPTGNFVCVGRCSLSGELLGPPNYHGYNERVLELHRTRFPEMSLEEYRRHIEIVRDPEMIERWRKECRVQKVFRLKGAGKETRGMRWSEAEVYFLRHYADKLLREVRRAIVPPAVIMRMPETELKRLVRQAWKRESRTPLTMALALRPAFRHMGLYAFKANRGETFVTPVRPHPLRTEHVVVHLKEVLGFLREHPGCTRQQLVEGLRPGAAPESSEVAAVLSPLRWLIEKGHVVEFFNGTLALPAMNGGRSGRSERGRPRG